jgi:hypothetical protein
MKEFCDAPQSIDDHVQRILILCAEQPKWGSLTTAVEMGLTFVIPSEGKVAN